MFTHGSPSELAISYGADWVHLTPQGSGSLAARERSSKGDPGVANSVVQVAGDGG